MPCPTLSDVGEAAMVKLPIAVTISVTVAFCWIPPPLPVTVIGYVPAAVFVPTVRVMVELPAPGAAILLGLKLTVVPVGIPVADRLIALLKPPLMVVVMVDVPALPCTMPRDVGEAAIVKLLPVRKATICMIHCPDGLTGAVAL